MNGLPRRIASLTAMPVVLALFCTILIFPPELIVLISRAPWFEFSLIFTMIVLERLLAAEKRLPRDSVAFRDVSVTLINILFTGAIAGAVFYSLLAWLPQSILDRDTLFDWQEPVVSAWLQVPAVLLLFSFGRYWIHRAQHGIPILWRFHSYHHRLAETRALNTFVSHPIDLALRHTLVFVILGLLGFSPFAVFAGVALVRISSIFSHCGADVRGGVLSFILVTPEVHRWHHSAKVPAGHRHAVNFGVGLVVWDLVFGTFYLPRKAAGVIAPEEIGHPDGIDDEGNVLRYFFVPMGLGGPLHRLTSAFRRWRGGWSNY